MGSIPYLMCGVRSNRLDVPTLVRGLNAASVVKPCNPRIRTPPPPPPFKETRHPDRVMEPMPSKPFIGDL
jgi:hypothetical protein